MKVKIVKAFHRFVPTPDGRSEIRQDFAIGEVPEEATEEEAEIWIAAGLAVEIKAAPSAAA